MYIIFSKHLIFRSDKLIGFFKDGTEAVNFCKNNERRWRKFTAQFMPIGADSLIIDKTILNRYSRRDKDFLKWIDF